jgi:antitoxin component YwqK of YwqJK toxin-antitoxin module
MKYDTVPVYYEKTQLETSQTDSILLLERYRKDRHWNVSRYKLENGNSQLWGWQKEYNEKGWLTSELHCELGEKKCKYWKDYQYYPSGEIGSEGFFDNGKPDSTHRGYYSNGQIRYEMIFENGRLQNVTWYFDIQGNSLSIGSFVNGNGNLNIYSINGKLIKVNTYKDGKKKKSRKVK